MGKIAYRRVPPYWIHPMYVTHGRELHRPLHDGARFAEDMAEWQKHRAKWDEGLMEQTFGDRRSWAPIPPDAVAAGFERLFGYCPKAENYAPVWTPEQATAWQVYEEVSEGTPISKVYPDLDTMAREIAAECGHSFEAMRKKILATVEYGFWYIDVKEFEEGGKYYNYPTDYPT